MAHDAEDDDDDRDQSEDHDDQQLEQDSDFKSRKPTQNDRSMAMFCHLGALLGGIILPLVIWMTQKDKSAFVDKHGKEAVNFCLSLMIASIVLLPTVCCTFGLLHIIMMVFGIVWTVQAGMAANRGKMFRYPYCMRIIK